MAYSLVNAIFPLLWVVLIITVATFIFALYICLVVSRYLKSKRNEWPQSDWTQKIAEFDNFSGVWRTMLTVFQSFTGGLDWTDVVEPLLSISLIHGVVYLVFFILVVFGLLNVVNGLFVESACSIAKTDRTALIDSAIEEEMQFKQDMTEVFHIMDRNDNGFLEFEEFHSTVTDERVRAFFASLGLPCNDTLQFFTLLDKSGRGRLTLQEFLEGSEKLRGPSMTVDMMLLRYDVNKIMKTVLELSDASKDLNARLSEHADPNFST